MFWDTDFDRKFDEAIDELIKEEKARLQATESEQKTNAEEDKR